MGEQEKKAIEYIKYLIDDFKRHREKTLDKEFDDKQIDTFTTILNLIKKQQKEIEELKYLESKTYQDYAKLKQKIKDKIEEYINSLKENLDEDRRWCDIEFIENLESLEKELLEE